MSNQLKVTNELININKPLLSVKDILIKLNYPFNNLFLDKFWTNIKDDMWIYIDDNMLKYIGYNRSEYKKNKQDYLNILKDNFEFDNDYKLLFSKDFKNSDKNEIYILEYNYLEQILDKTIENYNDIIQFIII